MPLFELRTFRVLTTAFVYLLALAFLYYARYTLIAFLLALLFAYLLEPAVSWLQRVLRLRRGFAIAILYAALTGAVAIFFVVLGPHLVNQAERLGRELPTLSEQISSGNLVARVGGAHGWSAQTQLEITRLLAQHRQDILRIEMQLGGYAATFIKDLWWIVLIPILSVFYLASGRELGRGILGLAVPHRRRQFLDVLMSDLHYVLAHFIRAQLSLMLIAIGVYLGFLTLMQVPDSLALGLSAGVLEFIPTLGPILAAVLILLVSFLLGYQHWIILALFLAAWRLVQDYINAPKIMGEHLKLHPFLVIFAVLAGGELAGVLGVFLSIPIVASLRVFWIRWQAYGARPVAEPPVAPGARP